MTSVYLLMLIKNKANINDLVDDFNATRESLNLKIYLIKAIRNEFEKHCNVAKQNLLLACLEKPIYGPLAAVHSLIINNINNISDSNSSEDYKEINLLKSIISDLIELCFEVSQVTSKIVNSSSPEGIFPSELVQVINFMIRFFNR
jgi:hypothetical protein